MGPNFILDKGYRADTAITQFYAVKLTAKDAVEIVDTLGEYAHGICQEEVTAGDATNGRIVDVRLIGITRAKAGGTIALNDKLRVAADGRLVAVAAATADQNVIGIAQMDAVANDLFDVLLTPGLQATTS